MTVVSTPLRLGTRRSRLALTQSAWVADLLRVLGHDVEIVEVVTEGDLTTAPLTQIGGTGVFASAIRRALLAGEVDLAVHSLKDLPVVPEPGLVVAAVPEREDPRDALVSRRGGGLDALPEGAVVGTGSPRRHAQLAARRPDLAVREIRGNVDSRLRRVDAGELDAVVLAGAGLRRLGLEERVDELLDPEVMLPAAGQGALAVECREDRADVVAAVADLDHTPSRAAVTAERALLATLEAGCTAPIGALARPEPVASSEDVLRLDGVLGATGGHRGVRCSLTGPAADPATLGRRLAHRLLDGGADALRARVRASPDRPRDLAAPSPMSPRHHQTDQQECST